MGNVIDNKVLRDIVIMELEKYHTIIVTNGLEGRERVEELIEILEDDDDNGQRLVNS